MSRSLLKLVAPVALAASLLAPLAAAAQAAPTATLVAAQSDIAFTSRQMGVPVDGHFKRFDAKVSLDPKQPASGSVMLTIDLASVSMGAPDVEAELAKPDWFDTRKTASATFQSSAIAAAGAGKFDVAGKLTIKGRSQDIKVPVTLTQSGSNSVATGQFTLKRLAYKIGDGDWADTSMVADDVIVKFKLALTGLPAL